MTRSAPSLWPSPRSSPSLPLPRSGPATGIRRPAIGTAASLRGLTTSSADIEEADATIARWTPSDDGAEQHVVGRSEAGSLYDPMRRHVTGDIVWSWFDAPGSAELHLARLGSGDTTTRR